MVIARFDGCFPAFFVDDLELRVIIDPPPADQPPEDQARTVLTAIQNELETWPTGSTSSLSPA